MSPTPNYSAFSTDEFTANQLSAVPYLPASSRVEPSMREYLLEDSPGRSDGDFRASGIPAHTPTAGGNGTRVLEWDDDNGALIADAYNVRRLLRLGFRLWGLHVKAMDCILDAVYVAEKECELRQSLSVLLAWLVFCQLQQTHRDKSMLLARYQRKNFLRESFRAWRRLYSGVSGVPPFQSRKGCRLLKKSVWGWKSVIDQYFSPFRRHSKQHNEKSTLQFFQVWKRARTQRYLDIMQAESIMETSAIKRIFCRLKNFAEKSKTISQHMWKRNNALESAVLASWRSRARSSGKLRQSILNNKTAVYSLYKLSRALCMAVHVGIFFKSRKVMNESVATVALRKWFEYTKQANEKRQQTRTDLKQKSLKVWFKFTKQSLRLDKGVKKYKAWQSSIGQKNALRYRFDFWKDRRERRTCLRSSLADLKERSAIYLIINTLVEWQSVASREHALSCKGKLIGHLCIERLFQFWKNASSHKIAIRVKEELASVFRQKTLGRILIGCFEIVQRRRVWILATNDRAAQYNRCMHWTRFKKSFNLAEKRRKIDTYFRHRSINTTFNCWVNLFRATCFHLARESAMVPRLLFFVLNALSLNVIVAKRGRMDSVVSVEFLKRCAFNRFKRFFVQQYRVNYIHNRGLIASAVKRWVQYMVICHSVSRIDHICENFLSQTAIHQMHEYANQIHQQDEENARLIETSIKRHGISSWRLAALHSRVVRFRNQRSSLSSDRSLKKKIFKSLIEEYMFRKKLLSVCHRRNERLARLVFHIRNSGWRLEVTRSLASMHAAKRRVSFYLYMWEQRTVKKIESKQRCISASVGIRKYMLRTLLMSMVLFAKNKRDSRMSVISAWRQYSVSSTVIRVHVLGLVPRLAHKKLKIAFTGWVSKVVHREFLRDRVSNFASNHSRRLVVSSLIGLAQHVSEKKQIVQITGWTNTKRATAVLDKWIHATVFAMSLREVLGRVEHALDNMCVFRVLDTLRNHNRVARFRERKSVQIDQKSLAKQRLLAEAAILGWSAIAYKVRCHRDKSIKVLKRRFLKQLRLHAQHQQTHRETIYVADEFAASLEAKRLTDLMIEIVSRWTWFANKERDLRVRQFGIAQTVNERLLMDCVEKWRCAVEYKLYEEDLGANEQSLIEKIENRTKSNVLTFFTIVIRESLGMLRFASELRENKLVHAAMTSFVSQAAIARKRAIVERLVNHRIAKEAFLQLFTEVYLAIKERLVWKRLACEKALHALRVYAEKEQIARVALVRGQWIVKSGNRSRRLNHTERHALIAFRGWKFMANQSKLTTQYLPAFDDLSYADSYTEQKRVRHSASVSIEASPLDTPATQAASVPSQIGTPTIFSYRELRPKRRSESHRESIHV